MKVLHERAEGNQTERIADLEDEAATLQRQNLILHLEIKALRRDLRRVRRNLGYRLVNGVSRALKPLARLIPRNERGGPVQFPRITRNGTAAAPFSVELQHLLGLAGQSFPSVFFSSATDRTWALHKVLSRTRIRQLCFSPADLEAAVTSSFFAIPEKPFAAGKGPPMFAHAEMIVLDASEPGLLWPLLKGRFWPHQKILFHGTALMEEFKATQRGPDFLFYSAPPAPWLDPRHSYQPSFAPWKSARRQWPASLPSGNRWPKISVVTPSFNQSRFVSQTIESVLGQNYPDLEYLILDGGSTDDTPEILNHYRARLAYSCTQKDKGQADAINKGFARATGEIMAWVNSDDQYAADALMHVARAFDLFPEADVVVGGCGLIEEGIAGNPRVHHCSLPIGKVMPLPLAQLLDVDNCWLKGHFFYQPEVFWRRQIWEAAGGHVSDDLYYCFDYDLWVRMAQAGAKILHLPDLLALYRVHPGQKTYGRNLPYLPELRLVKSRRECSGASHESLTKA